MSDRTAAGIFGSVFETLAMDPSDDHKALARRFWKMSKGYDFHPLQMECGESLAKLGLELERDE